MSDLPIDGETTSGASYPQRGVFPQTLTDDLAARARATSGESLMRTTPLTGRNLGSLPISSITDVDNAYAAARQAQQEWAQRDVKERAAFLLRLHDLVLIHREELLDLIQLESGKARAHAFEEIMDVAGVCRHYGRKAPSYLREQRSIGAIPLLTQVTTYYRPKGVVGIVAPWNYPLSMSVTDALAALVAGNGVVLRPDDKATYTCLRAAQLCDEAGLPEGLLQIVLGDGPNIGGAVLERADYLMFTGSTATGRTVARDAGERLIGASLELGGKNALYVAQDADLQRAAKGAQGACFASAGQLCISTERVILHEKIADEFLKLFVSRVKTMKLSVSLEWGADMGSLISAEQLERVQSHLDDAVSKGAKVLAGGHARPDIGPYVFEPTVLTDVTTSMTCRDEETFGPLVSVYLVPDDDAAIALANDTELGLNASIWSKNIAHARAIAAQIRCGTVNINEGYAAAYASNGAPMGGMKASGLGRRHGYEGLAKYTELQNVAVQRGMGISPPDGVSQERFAAAMNGALTLMRKVRMP